MSTDDGRTREQWFEKWLAPKPEVVKVMARKYPPGTKFLLHERECWVVSYNEDGGLSVSDTDPAQNYRRAIATRRPICSCCVTKLNELRQ